MVKFTLNDTETWTKSELHKQHSVYWLEAVYTCQVNEAFSPLTPSPKYKMILIHADLHLEDIRTRYK